MIKYELNLRNPQAHVVTVKLTFTQKDTPSQLMMPAWVPGSYTLRDFSKHIISICAYVEGAPDRTLVLEKLDSHTYQLEAFDGQVTIEYDIYCWDRSVRGAHFDLTHGFFNGACLFLCVQSQKNDSLELTLLSPEKTYQNEPWQVATTLPMSKVNAAGFGKYHAKNYEHLIDHPIEMGTFETISFDVKGVPHSIALTGRFDADLNRLANDVKQICLAQAEFFEQLPFEQYLFLLTVTEDGYGGLEHCDSTALMSSVNSLPSRAIKENTKEYRQLLGLFSHEYFHSWNVKRIKPLAFHHLDLSQPKFTQQLWAFEGITSYYDDYMLRQSDCISAEEYLEILSQTITRVHQSPGRFKQTVKDSSFDAWTKFYHPNENSPNVLVSYYTKGSLCACLFDLTIRLNTHGDKSLTDVMRYLWQTYGKTHEGVPEGAIDQVLLEYGGQSMKPLIHLCLETTEELPLAQVYHDFGVSLDWDYPEASKLPGDAVPLSLGVKFKASQSLMVSQVIDGSPAQNAGISAFDKIVAINHSQATTKNLSNLLKTKKAGEEIQVHLFREDRLLELSVTLEAADKSEAKLTLMSDLTQEQKIRRQAWLGI